jgi:dipeptidyl aminopeptidase/acylaminoacyl peptidase
MGKFLFIALFAFFAYGFAYSQEGSTVSFEKWISLRSAGSPIISPDGRTVAYTVTNTDWSANSYHSEIWIWRAGAPAFQLTRTNGNNSYNYRFTPGGKWLSFLADRGDKAQIWLISLQGGEAFPITNEEDGVNDYEWSPDGKQIALTKTEAESKKEKDTKQRYGGFGVVDEEYHLTHLWLLDFNYDSIQLAGSLPCYESKADSAKKKSSDPCYKIPRAKRLTEGKFNVSGFDWNPIGAEIIFNRQPDPLINSGMHSDIASIEVSTKKIKPLVSNPAADFFNGYSPDGKQFCYSSAVDDSISQFYKNNRLFIYDIASGKSKEVAVSIDEDKSFIKWTSAGIWLNVLSGVRSSIYKLDPSTGNAEKLSMPLELVGAVDLTMDGSKMVYSGRHFDQLQEVFIPDNATTQITNMSAQINGWNTPLNEVIQWKSKDGAIIEGILLKPRNFDPKKKYPLLVVIHGGPTGVDRPDPVPTYVYPIMQWVEKGAVVLRVNYRGSAGYGAKFRALNVRNLGVGDMWDVMSGVDFLIQRGIVDSSKMGCMGWSQGGYISAFLTTNTNRFKAISVGAGISNWVTYYVNTDITPFTRQYLQATPWSDMEVYKKTSPMTNINKAQTPTLIQHGEFDKRVPIPNAYELYRGLQDRGIPSKLIVYKGFGHGINKPRERLAAVWHNWQWFGKYVFGENIDIPVE